MWEAGSLVRSLASVFKTQLPLFHICSFTVKKAILYVVWPNNLITCNHKWRAGDRCVATWCTWSVLLKYSSNYTDMKNASSPSHSNVSQVIQSHIFYAPLWYSREIYKEVKWLLQPLKKKTKNNFPCLPLSKFIRWWSSHFCCNSAQFKDNAFPLVKIVA